MTRFEIQDIADQNKNGITYFAFDHAQNINVALRRFFPFGEENGGLDLDEQRAYANVCKRLSEFKHPSFRSVIYGDADPVDGMPYLVTKWLEGTPVSMTLGGKPMEPRLTIELIRNALEVSIKLSDIFGQEAVWIDTNLHSIIFEDDKDGGHCTFWICPFKWLGNHDLPRDIKSIIILTEELTGWSTMLFSNQAGLGLGGWLKSMRLSPDISLADALESLLESTDQQAATIDQVIPPEKEEITQESISESIQETPKPVLQSASSGTFSKKGIFIGLALTLLLIGSLLFFLKNRSSSIISDNNPSTESESAGKLTPDEQFKARALELRRQLQESESQAKADDAEIQRRGKKFTPEDTNLLKRLNYNTPVTLRATLVGTQLSSSGKSLYLLFSKPHKKGQVRGVAHQKDFKGKYDSQTFEKFIGKEIEINGFFMTESSKNPLLVKITSVDQLAIIAK